MYYIGLRVQVIVKKYHDCFSLVYATFAVYEEKKTIDQKKLYPLFSFFFLSE